MQKSGFFSKTSSSNLLKTHKKYPWGSITMPENDGSGHPPKKFQYGKIEIFRPSQSPTGIKGAMDQISVWKAPNDRKTLTMGILHDYKSCWPPIGPFRYQRGAQKGPFGLKQTLTGWKPSERPMTPHECPKQHKTLCMVGLYCYSTFSNTSSYFGDSMGAQRGRMCPQNSPFSPFKDLTMVWKVKREFKTPPNTYLGWLHLLACFHNSLAFPEMSKRVILTSKRPPQGCFLTFSPKAWFNMSWNCLKSSENSVATIWTPHMPMFQSKQLSTKKGALWKGLGPKKPLLGSGG